MYLTQENAANYLGKSLTATKKMFHNYPLTVIKFPSGKYGYKDSCGVCMKAPSENDKFNAVYFDFAARQ